MSTDFGSVKTIESSDYVSPEVFVTRFWGGPEHGVCVQLTVGGKFVQLDKRGAKKLRKKLKRATKVERNA